MKAWTITGVLLVIVISLAACINIYTPGSTSTPGTPQTPTTPTTPTTPATPATPATPTAPAIQFVQFEDRTWVLVRYGKSNNLQDVIPGKEVNARFNSASGKVIGTAGCNSYSADYTRTVNRITITHLSNTMMNCPIPPGIMAQENAFKDALMGAESCRIVNNKLEINCTLDRLLVFQPK